MRKLHKKRIAVKIDVSSVMTGNDSIEPDHTEPIEVAFACVTAIIDAIDCASEAAVKGDRKPTIPEGMPVDLVSAPGIVYSLTWGDLVAAELALQID